MKRIMLILSLLTFWSASIHSSTDVEKVKVLTINVWGVPDALSSILGSQQNKQLRLKKLCEKLKIAKDTPDVVLIQELWDSDSAEYIIDNCGYEYSLYADKADFPGNVTSRGSKLNSNFFEAVKEEVFNFISNCFVCNLVDLFYGLVKFFHIPGSAAIGSSIMELKAWLNCSNVKSGLLILSKYEILDQYRMVYSNRGLLENVLSDFERSVTKSLLMAKVHIPNKGSFWLGNTHLIANHEVSKKSDGTYELDTYNDTRRQQITEAMVWINKIAGASAVIFGGDLNTGPGYPLWKSIKAYMEENGIDGDMVSTSTYSVQNPYVEDDEGKLDHIFGLNGAKAINEQTVLKNDPVSDHFGVLKTYDVPLSL